MKSRKNVKTSNLKIGKTYNNKTLVKRKCQKPLEKRSIRSMVCKTGTVITDGVKAVNHIMDLMAHSAFDPWHFIKQESYDLKVECLHASQLDDHVKDWAFDLCKNNTKEMYENTIGWDDNVKRIEMFDSSSRYLLVRIKDSKELIAFSHFRFDMDYGEEVLYCYELHVVPKARSKGIGKFLLNLLQLLAFTYNMSKLVLTVFKSNSDGIRFYQNYNFEEDHTSPQDCSYIILSKYKEDWEE